MSSYGSMSPSDEGFDRYEPPFYCQPSHQGSPMGSGMYWGSGGGGGETREYEPQEIYHDQHYIGRTYGYEEIQLVGNEPYDGVGYHHAAGAGAGAPHQHAHHAGGLECDMESMALRYERPGTSFVRVVKRRTTANKKERRRTQSINTAFSDLRECIPNVPADTKLSKMVRKRSQDINTAFSTLRRQIPHVLPDTKMTKIKTLRLATSYISYLLRALECEGGEPAGGFRAELHHAPARARPRHAHDATQHASERRGKGRTGWPQHVWALELKTEQNLQT